MIIRYGVEGVVYSSPDPDLPAVLTHDSANNRLVSVDGEIVINLFQKVKVQITVTEAGNASAQRSKLQLQLVEPAIPGMVKSDGMEVDEPESSLKTKSPGKSPKSSKKQKRK